MSDFFYRVNWATTSNIVPNLRVNRITSWAALAARFAQIDAAGGSFGNPEAFAVRLEIDHSTDQSRTEVVEPWNILKLVEELVSFASANVQKGERA
jgi:hypothetical protein